MSVDYTPTWHEPLSAVQGCFRENDTPFWNTVSGFRVFPMTNPPSISPLPVEQAGNSAWLPRGVREES